MMGDLKKRASFAKLVNYVNNPMTTQPLQGVCRDRQMTSRGVS